MEGFGGNLCFMLLEFHSFRFRFSGPAPFGAQAFRGLPVVWPFFLLGLSLVFFCKVYGRLEDAGDRRRHRLPAGGWGAV